MNFREENDHLSRPDPRGVFESPFLAEELFVGEAEPEWEARLVALEAESPFRSAFEEGSSPPFAAEEPEEEFVGKEWGVAEGFSPLEAEAYGEELLAEPEESRELCYEQETPYEEGETGDEKPMPRMKFELQTSNRIWRNDGTSATLLERKYGPDDFLVDGKGVRLESETNGVLEFETEWFRSWPKLEKALKKAVTMTDDMNGAAASKFEKSRKAFPFSVDHLRKGSTKELRQGFWDRKPGMEGEKEKILQPGEELEVEIIDASWKAGIQSSESFLLEYYESFLRQHEWPFYRDGTIRHAQTVLDGANTAGMAATEVAKLRSFLQIIVNYIMRGQGGTESDKAGAFADVEGMPAKQAFTLMSRTNFASMYKVLLSDKEKRLFQTIVKDDAVLKEMGLDRKSPVFIKGYETKHHEPGPTVYQWLAGITKGVDLLSVQSGKNLSTAMGRYNVETRKGKKDRWLVKFETRNTVLGAVGIKAKDWVTYAQKLFDQAGTRESNALNLLRQQGVADESKLANFVFHARHPELEGRRLRTSERALAQEWLRIRNDLVRPSLQGVQPELEQCESAGFADDEFETQAASRYGEIDHELSDEAGYADDDGEEAFSPDELSFLDADLEDEDRRDPGLEGETNVPSPEIRNLQRSLNTWRIEKGQPPVRDDGLPGPETRRAVLEFQKASGIKNEDGIAGPATRLRLRLILDILRNIPTTPLFAEDRRRFLELVGGPGFRSLPEPEQNGVLTRIRDNQRPGTLDTIRLLTNLVTEPGFERLPASSQKLMLRILAARPGDADLTDNLIQLISSTGFRNLEESMQNWVLKRIEKNAGNRTRVDNLENLITTTSNFDQLSRQSRTVMLTALANRPGDSRLVDNFRRAVDRADFRTLDQQTQSDMLTRIVNSPRTFVHVDNLMSLITTPGFGDLALSVTSQVLDGLSPRFGTTVLTSAIIGNLMSVLTAKGFEKLRPEIRDLILDSQAHRPDNTQLASALRTLIENPKFRHDQREALKAVLQTVDSIP